MPYTADKPGTVPTADELRSRIPGWGVDRNPADRPSFPRERIDPTATGAHWDFPDRQLEQVPRERSIEHAILTPVFGTSAPTKGLSGVVRRYAYRRFSEARAAHWLLLIAGDRIDAVESHLRSFGTAHPDNPVTETGILSEYRRHGWSSRMGRHRVDTRHLWIDPVLVAGPWIASGWLVSTLARRAIRFIGRRR